MVVPAVNSKGIFKFEEPYASAINENQILLVSGVRLIGELIDESLDVFGVVYDSFRRPMEDMDKDKNDDVPIITFITEAKKYIYVPANKIVSAPQNVGVYYQDKIIGINVGSLPEDYSLDGLKSDILELVKGRIGVEAKISVIDGSAKVLVSYSDDELLKAQRDTVKATSGTYTNDGLYGSFFIGYQRCKQEKEELVNQLTHLKCGMKKVIVDGVTTVVDDEGYFDGD